MVSRSTVSSARQEEEAERSMQPIVGDEPAAPERTVGTVAVLSDDELDQAIAAADRAADVWAGDIGRRSRALLAWANRLEQDSRQSPTCWHKKVGKPIREANAEVARTVGILRYYAQAAYDPLGELFPGADSRSETVVRRVPVGVVAAICPWNFPLAIPAWKLAPALAYGNAAVFKPASAAVVTGQRLVELSRPDIPSDVLAFAPMPSTRVRRLIDDMRIGAISFTGSAIVGRDVIARTAARGAAVQAEMGGQNPSIVLGDADLDHAASTITNAAMGYAGPEMHRHEPHPRREGGRAALH